VAQETMPKKPLQITGQKQVFLCFIIIANFARVFCCNLMRRCLTGLLAKKKASFFEIL